jgi:nitric oxide reductase NorQ protein
LRAFSAEPVAWRAGWRCRYSDPRSAPYKEEPSYQAVGDEVEVFEAAHRNQLPLLLKGSPGRGKTRFMQYTAWRWQRPLIRVS